MRILLPILCWLVPVIGFTQGKDSLPVPGHITPRAEVLSGGFIDIVQNGQMNASARLFRLYIGEPGKFQIPVSVCTGVTANNFSSNIQAQDYLLPLINPGSGVFNMSFDGSSRMIGGKKKLTTLQLQYQTGLRFLSIMIPANFQNVNFFNVVSGAGLTFITGAWEKGETDNMGLYWLNFRGIYSVNPSEAIRSLFADPIEKNIWGYSTGMGIEISKTLHVKIFYFRFVTNDEHYGFDRPFLQLSVSYSVK